MVPIHVSLTVRNQSDIEDVARLLATHSRLSRSEPGCLRFELYQSNLDPHAFFILEEWESQAALEVHREADAFQTIYAPQVLPLVERAAHPVTVVEGR
ncbi:MAG: antibiotic biosynthesis monooxygenase [Planctomycetaceae bacterium]|nr:antibiotic biosynthesis monooxygenase [Planctomycetaceae bacterium]